MGNECWYVVQSKPHRELVVCSQLRRLLDPSCILFPRIRTYFGVRPLFPSYLLIFADMENLLNYHSIKYTRGVLRIIGTRQDGPIPVSEEAVDIIRQRIGQDGLISQEVIFKIGARIRVRKGPLKDLMGILEKPVGENDRVQVLFRLLKYPLRAVMRFKDLAIA